MLSGDIRDQSRKLSESALNFGRFFDQVLFGFAILWAVSGIFAIKIEGCQKSRGILDVFSPSQILGGRPSKIYTHFITIDSQHVVW